MAVDAKGAVQAAMKYLGEMYSKEQIADVLLEEIDTSKGGGSWLVTLSFYRPSTPFEVGSIGQILWGRVRFPTSMHRRSSGTTSSTSVPA